MRTPIAKSVRGEFVLNVVGRMGRQLLNMSILGTCMTTDKKLCCLINPFSWCVECTWGPCLTCWKKVDPEGVRSTHVMHRNMSPDCVILRVVRSNFRYSRQDFWG